jgi:hypothetical protein
MSRRLLPRFYADGLREHIEGDGFMSDFDFTTAAKAMHVFHGSFPVSLAGTAKAHPRIRRRFGVANVVTRFQQADHSAQILPGGFIQSRV